ncbi:hypothetical protein ACIA47_32270 [Micromonospora sp. NPDC051227]|uniref:hypothetical protein n=1 Tax=Micromonospora sp. NPDC051227 TaxID=3364285 RepID=UPI00378D7C29
MSKLAVIYHSALGTGTQIAKAIVGAAEAAGAKAAVRKVAESAPQAEIDSNPLRAAHDTATADVAAPTVEEARPGVIDAARPA